MHVGGATCAIPPTFGEVGVIVILKIVESVFFFFFNDRKVLKEEYDSQPSAQSVCP